jgi:hypothetical protein
MQPINAENLSTVALETFGGGEPAYACGEKKDRISAMLFAAETVLAQEGQEDSRWIGSEEFRQFADEYGWSNSCLGAGTDKAMTLKTPFGADVAFIRFRTDQQHPQFGSGLLVTTHIRSHQTFDEACAETAGLNFFESRSWTDFPQLGCWNPYKTAENEADWVHGCFIPNALFLPGLVAHLAVWSLERVRWVRRTRFPELEDKTMLEIISSRKAET